ncbi:cytochrome b/b6 domain-containing protein [Thauera butanivorans]|uniref:cytochrome b/b6 domain-containing protein n=1 Tax=Thauera butanivorans TaxID=86174 RepID=UPI003AB4DF82
MNTRIYIYKRYERFWHWSQALLIIVMMITGFEVHGSYTLLGFGRAVDLHTLAAWSLLVLWAFTIFWQFTTGEWRQYLPSLKNVLAMVRYYTIGIFSNAPHPFRKSAVQKHNPLQRLAYLALLALISPLIWISGLLYLFHGSWASLGLDTHLSLEAVAIAHTAGAFMIATFFVAHVYLTTTGHTVFAHIKAMITGWEEIGEHQEKAGKAAR